MSNQQGDYHELARLAREKRQKGEYVLELRAVLAHFRGAKLAMHVGPDLSNALTRARLFNHITNAIDLAEQELKRLRVEI